MTPEACARPALRRRRRSDNDGGFTRLAALADSGGSRFAVLPTMNVQLGRQVGDHAPGLRRLLVPVPEPGRALGDVLEPGRDRTGITDFWVQSFNFGFELRY